MIWKEIHENKCQVVLILEICLVDKSGSQMRFLEIKLNYECSTIVLMYIIE